MSRARGFTALLVVVAPLALAGFAAAWDAAQKIDAIGGNSTELNTPSQDGCPIQSPDGLSLYIASSRPGGKGGLDIWMARPDEHDGAVGSTEERRRADKLGGRRLLPDTRRQERLLFVSRKALPGACGQGDIYFTHRTGRNGWAEPERLLCSPAGPNSALDEQGPSWVEMSGKLSGKKYVVLLAEFGGPPASPARSSPARGGTGSASVRQRAVSELNDAAANDIQPNVRADGLEIVFSSSRRRGVGVPQDIWAATRGGGRADPWSAPANLGSVVNTAAAETRPSLSRDGTQLLFGRSPGPEGSGDIFVTTRP